MASESCRRMAPNYTAGRSNPGLRKDELNQAKRELIKLQVSWRRSG
jgi:hypothetical protein